MPICDWITDRGCPPTLYLSDILQMIDAYIFETPPIGYDFTPNITEVFDIVDSFLGFGTIECTLVTGSAHTTLTFWGAPCPDIVVIDTATTKTLPSVVIPDLSEFYTIRKAYGVVNFGTIYNSYNGANYVDGNQYIQVDNSSSEWASAVSVPNKSLYCPGTAPHRLGGQIHGHIDISGKVAFGSTTAFRWYNARAQRNNLYIYGLQPGVVILT